MGSLFSGARAVPQLPSNMPIGTVFNDLQKKLATGKPPNLQGQIAGASQGDGSLLQRLGQGVADQRRRAPNVFPQTGLRATLASGGSAPAYGGTMLGGGR